MRTNPNLLLSLKSPAGGSRGKGNVIHLSLLANSVGLVRCCAGRAALQTMVYKKDNSSAFLYSGVFKVTGLSFAGRWQIIYSKVNPLVSPKAKLLCRIQAVTECYSWWVLGAVSATEHWWRTNNTLVVRLYICNSRTPNLTAQLGVWWHLLFKCFCCLSVDCYFQRIFIAFWVCATAVCFLECVCNSLFFLTSGTDEETVLKILTSRNNAQRQEIASAFKTLFGRVRRRKIPLEMSWMWPLIIT